MPSKFNPRYFSPTATSFSTPTLRLTYGWDQKFTRHNFLVLSHRLGLFLNFYLFYANLEMKILIKQQSTNVAWDWNFEVRMDWVDSRKTKSLAGGSFCFFFYSVLTKLLGYGRGKYFEIQKVTWEFEDYIL